MNNADFRERVREALKRTDIMALSTIDEDGGPAWCFDSRIDRQRHRVELSDLANGGG